MSFGSPYGVLTKTTMSYNLWSNSIYQQTNCFRKSYQKEPFSFFCTPNPYIRIKKPIIQINIPIIQSDLNYTASPYQLSPNLSSNLSSLSPTVKSFFDFHNCEEMLIEP